MAYPGGDELYILEQRLWVKKHNVGRGTQVLVLYRPSETECDERGWASLVWVPQMDGSVGFVLPVESVTRAGVLLSGGPYNWYYPYFVLEVVNNECHT